MRLVYLYGFLLAAVVCEVIATTALSKSHHFTKLLPSLIAVCGYAFAFWLLTFPMRQIPTGIVYAFWSGLGIVLIVAADWILFDQKIDLAGLLGLGLIITGVITVNVFSSSSH